MILWEVTYACPLRCPFCYSESGLRPSRTLPLEGMLRIADRLLTIAPRVVHLSGGEPLVFKGLFQVAERLQRGGVDVVLTTSGFGLDAAGARAIGTFCHSVHVSIDGPDAALHDRLRGKEGSFAAALDALSLLDRLARARREAGQPRLRFGIDCVVLRSNFEALPRLVTDVASRFSEMEFVIYNGVVPQGLASRADYADELLDEAQMKALDSGELEARLNQLAGERLAVFTRNNFDLQMHPETVREGTAWTLDRMIVEPDGAVRAMEVYEGIVGNVLDEPLDVLWRRSCERRADPFVAEQLGKVKSTAEWSAATRVIDRRYADGAELLRLDKRRPYRT
ncbi:MAG TPA: radical SAM protein [Polyangia bacterium]|nr:radical SAM protein [Polyangia bacterium]